MKKTVLLLAMMTLVACKNEPKESFGTAATKVDIVLDPSLEKGKMLFEGRGMCLSCHQPDKKIIGPSIKEIATIYKKENADMVAFLKEEAKPIVDPSQYEVMRTNFAVTKTMADEELQAIVDYMYSFTK
jgi:cytochrome c